ncbi:hypothetical protein CHCC20488_2751 [Bacillus paralicheniformis]|nr:hypothetical protein SC10_B2orf03999 [Bacillus paralicheniformis]OLG08051.1 hypothetical protein B4125_2232 [Bacillus paralicheniformis]TWJ74810.1 hypothetical protein CHCC20497_3895 [Bacillus paralicheniformis]TWM08239.1 hypothetical protein CHCC15136_1786 [Bacillus paralicheniformis]TWM44317.1 hypothetical protein CHCC14817_4448 [Bacillus paralicheniformis]
MKACVFIFLIAYKKNFYTQKKPATVLAGGISFTLYFFTVFFKQSL